MEDIGLVDNPEDIQVVWIGLIFLEEGTKILDVIMDDTREPGDEEVLVNQVIRLDALFLGVSEN